MPVAQRHLHQARGQRNRRARRRAALGLLAAPWAVIACAALGASPAAAADAEHGGGSRVTPAQVKPPNDPLFRFQWHLPAIGIPAAWSASRGAGAVVAVLDTGVAYADRGRHRQAPDLAGTRFVAGWDFVDDDPYPDDVAPRDGRRSHGTLMAGLIAQTTGNALGGAGVAPAAAIMPVRVLEADLRGSASALARGVRFAVEHGADVISLSLAGPAPVPAVRDAIEHATAEGVTVVAATGNDGYDVVSWPAAYPDVIAVGAVRRDLTRASYSNYGRDLDLVAPGGAGERVDDGRGPSDGVLAQTLIGTDGRFCFCFTASTSAAAAQVSGVVALLVGAEPAIDRAAIRARLLSSARDLGAPGRDLEYGAGLVQAARALGLRPAAAARPAQSGRPSGRRNGWPLLAIGGAGAAVAVALLLAARRRRRRRG
jgi:serine protease